MSEETNTKPKRNDIGSLWKKKSKDGSKTFLSGVIKVDGVETQIIVFSNSYKEEGSNQPDYRIYPSEPYNKPQAVAPVVAKKKAVKAAPVAVEAETSDEDEDLV